MPIQLLSLRSRLFPFFDLVCNYWFLVNFVVPTGGGDGGSSPLTASAASDPASSTPANVNAVPGGASNAVISSPRTLADPTVNRFPCSVEAIELNVTAAVATYNLRDHDIVQWALRQYLFVKISSLTACVSQISVPGTDSESLAQACPVRFGLAPRDVAVTTANGISLLSSIPRLVNFLVTPTIASQKTVTWSDGSEKGIPFPPGIQLDLKAGELRVAYPRFIIGRKTVGTENETCLEVQLDFFVECSGVGFGAPH